MVRFLFKLCGVLVFMVIKSKLWYFLSPYWLLFVGLIEGQNVVSPCTGDELKERHLTAVLCIARRNSFW
jgi:hypothetical protein